MKRVTWLSAEDAPDAFPPADQALLDPPGLLAAGGDLSTERLLAAYARGIFPWYSPGQPVLWWSPEPRAVLFPAEFHCSRSLARRIRNGGFRLSVDRDFVGVIDACAAPRPASPGTWITSEMRAAYVKLHQRGFAHSVEVWRDGTLAGGLYGVRLAAVFFGESMFSRERDASKIALARLVALSAPNGLALIDCQLPSQHLATLGVRGIGRGEFEQLLRRHVGSGAASTTALGLLDG